MTQSEAIIEAFKALGGTRNKYEIEEWVSQKYGDLWKDFGTPLADMVPISHGGNSSSTIREELRVLVDTRNMSIMKRGNKSESW